MSKQSKCSLIIIAVILSLLVIILNQDDSKEEEKLTLSLLIAKGYDKTSQYMNISNMNISSLDPKVFSQFPILISLSLTNNKLSRIRSSTFRQVSSTETLERLMLSNNRLTTIDKYSFEMLSSLAYLTLEHNYLTRLSYKVFEGLGLSLLELRINNNFLSQIEIKSLWKLETLNLANNELTRIEANMFVDLVSLVDLNLSGNNLKLLTSESFKGYFFNLIFFIK